MDSLGRKKVESIEGDGSSRETTTSESGSLYFSPNVGLKEGKRIVSFPQTQIKDGFKTLVSNPHDFGDTSSSEEDDDEYYYKSDNFNKTQYFPSKSKTSNFVSSTLSWRFSEVSGSKINPNSLHVCRYCDFTAKSRSEIREHLKSHNEHPYKCLMCGSVCSNNGNLKRHLMLHSGKLPFKCSECNECFKTNHYLNVHQLKHSGLRPFKCEHCPAAFIQRSHLKKHSLKHQNPTSKCPYCDYISEFPKVLKKHVLSHSGKLRFQCMLCEYSGGQKTHLKQHMLKHSNIRPFSCYCGFSFKSKTNLERHLSNHSKQKKYKCISCDNASNQMLHLDKPSWVHENQTFVCYVCKYTCLTEDVLKEHMFSHVQ